MRSTKEERLAVYGRLAEELKRRRKNWPWLAEQLGDDIAGRFGGWWNHG